MGKGRLREIVINRCYGGFGLSHEEVMTMELPKMEGGPKEDPRAPAEDAEDDRCDQEALQAEEESKALEAEV